MKQIALVCLLIVIVSNSFGQHKYIPFPDSNTYWVVHQFDEFSHRSASWNWFIIGDTIINSTDYLVYAQDFDTSFKLPPLYGRFGIRNDTLNKKVFVYDYVSKFEKLLYDFSLEVGDTISESYGSTARYEGRVITKIDTLVIDNNKHLVFEVDSNLVNPYIEGIGSLSGPILESSFWFEGGFELVCTMTGVNKTPYFNRFPSECKLATGVVHHTDVTDKLLLFPNPNNGVFTLKLDRQSNGDLKIYNVLGNIVFQQTLLNTNSVEITLPQSLGNGVYLVQMVSEEVRISQRIVVRRE